MSRYGVIVVIVIVVIVIVVIVIGVIVIVVIVIGGGVNLHFGAVQRFKKCLARLKTLCDDDDDDGETLKVVTEVVTWLQVAICNGLSRFWL